jgi:hypothetical protein
LKIRTVHGIVEGVAFGVFSDGCLGLQVGKKRVKILEGDLVG